MNTLTGAVAASLLLSFSAAGSCFALGSHQVLNQTPTVQPAAHVFSVLRYGATGNGTTDDTVAIQNTISAAQSSGLNSVVYFPPGSYLFSSNLTASNVSMSGETGASTTLLSSNNATVNFTQGQGAKVYIANLTFQPQGGTGGTALNVGENNTQVLNNTFGSGFTTSLSINSAQSVLVSNNTFNIGTTSHATAISGNSCGSLSIQQNTISGAQSTTLTGISINSSSTTITKNTINGNIQDIATSNSNPIGIYCSAKVDESSSITNNVINGSSTGIYINNTGAPSISNNNITNAWSNGVYTVDSNPNIQQNIITSVLNGAGIQVTGSSPVERGNVTVSRNTVSSTGGASISLSGYSVANTFYVSQNALTNAGLKFKTQAVIDCTEVGIYSANVTQNIYRGNTTNLTYFVYVQQQGQAAGNKTNTMLPSQVNAHK
ncbi:MAG TPA: glycosyl hydrolase family 28-related protein [Drouetiella sp.]